MANVCALSLLVVVMVMTATVDAGYLDYFKNWRIAYKCPTNYMKSKFHYYAPYVNHVQLLMDLEAIDKDHNDDITTAEISDFSPMKLDLTAGVSRCEFAKMYKDRYGVKPALSSNIFTRADTNNDGVYNTADVTAPKADTNGDGKTSVCEMYTDFLNSVNRAGKARYDREQKARQIKADTDYYNNQYKKDWLSMFWSFFKSS